MKKNNNNTKKCVSRKKKYTEGNSHKKYQQYFNRTVVLLKIDVKYTTIVSWNKTRGGKAWYKKSIIYKEAGGSGRDNNKLQKLLRFYVMVIQ